MSKPNTPQVVVIGGGTGIYPVVGALQRLQLRCSCIINSSDSGGSTGRIRDEFGFPPVGDLRQSLAALANADSQQDMRQLLLYRFSKGTGLVGHNLGNLILTALQDIHGSTSLALDSAAKIFRIHGKVVPVTDDSVQLKIVYKNGSELIGEHNLDEKIAPTTPIDHVELTPTPKLNPKVAKLLKVAQYVIIGPGDFYASLASVLCVPRIKLAFRDSSAQVLYVGNLMTRATQTNGMTAGDHVHTIESYIGRPVDVVVLNSAPIPQSILSAYAREGECPVVDDLADDSRVVRHPLITPAVVPQQAQDALRRSLLRHDRERVQECLARILIP